jgi:hypothetical protein
MKFRRSLFAVAAGLIVMTMVHVPQTEAAQRIVVRRPYYGFYGPSVYYPYYYQTWGPQVYAAVPRLGNVKIDTHLKGASIYVDGGFAGTTGKLKQFSLQPGNHDIQVRNAAGGSLFQQRVQVLAGRTVEIKL